METCSPRIGADLTVSRPRRRQLLRPRRPSRPSLGKRGAAPGQHLGIGDRLPRPPRLRFGQRDGGGTAASTSPPGAARQAAERGADRRELAAQLLVEGLQPGVLQLQALVGGDELGDLIDNRPAAERARAVRRRLIVELLVRVPGIP
jgi:hypothetical protein